MALPLKIREEIDGFLITPWVKTIQERRPGIYTTTALLAPLPQGIPESRRQASKTRVEGLVIPRAQFLMMKYALYDNFRMQEYHQFVYFIIALERFELEKIRYAGYKISEK